MSPAGMTTQELRHGDVAEAPALELRSVRHEFASRAGTTQVFDGLDFGVRRGEFLAVVGPSGCGKTTLLRVMHGLLRPTSGDVLLGGRPLTDPSGGDVAMVFQQDSLLPWRTVWRNVTFGKEMRGRGPDRVDRARAEELLSTVGLDGFADHHPRQLSGGMRQRVNLARALYCNPDVLLMDEPFASLDAQTQEEMQAELLRIWGKLRNTVVFVTHRLEEAVYLADRVVVLTNRPTHVRTVVPVELERPRPLSVKRTPGFNALVDFVTTALRGD